MHFLPPLVFFVHALLVYLEVIQKADLHVKDLIAEQWHFNVIKAFEDDLSVLSTMIYGWLSLRLVQGYRKWLNNHISGTNHQTFGWLKNLLSFTGILGLALLGNICLDQVFHFYDHHFLHWQIFYIYLSFLIYYIAYRSYQKEAFIIPGKQKDLSGKSHVNSSKYSVSDRVAAKSAILMALEKDRLFLNSELTLTLLASFINLSPALVSETINKGLGKPFRTLINDFRVAEVKHKLLDRNYRHLSISGIALECGFNSEASFYRIFKSVTGLSPKIYLKNAPLYSIPNPS
jgi:AraC-like DNA-binding protein